MAVLWNQLFNDMIYSSSGGAEEGARGVLGSKGAVGKERRANVGPSEIAAMTSLALVKSISISKQTNSSGSLNTNK